MGGVGVRARRGNYHRKFDLDDDRPGLWRKRRESESDAFAVPPPEARVILLVNIAKAAQVFWGEGLRGVAATGFFRRKQDRLVNFACCMHNFCKCEVRNRCFGWRHFETQL